MSRKSKATPNPYNDLPYLDAIHQKRSEVGLVNALKQPIRAAVNGLRYSKEGMEDLIALLEETTKFIRQVEPSPRKRTSKIKESRDASD